LVLGGCLSNPSVEVDTESVELARGTSSDVTLSLDGAPVDDLSEFVWHVDDPALVTVAPSWDGKHLRIGGNLEGSTVVHVNSHGQTLDIAAHVGPPALVRVWIEPPTVMANIGASVEVKAIAVDTLFRVVDITRDSHWTVRNPDVATLDMAGMMLRAQSEGQTSLHVTKGDTWAVVPITILK
jgi:hypothetical protein